MGQATSDKKTKPRSVVNFMTEWNLFWDGLKGEDQAEPDLNDPFVTGKLQSLTLVQIKEMTKALSQGRRKLNQKMEILSKEIENSTQTVESLKLVGGEPSEIEKKINDLNDQGQQLSLQLQQLNERLKWARRREDELKKEQI